MDLPTPESDENMRLIRSLIESVNDPMPVTLSGASKRFQWALDLSRERKKELRHRVTFEADSPHETARNLKLAQGVRRIARGILWGLATDNDRDLDEPVLYDRAGGQPIGRWTGLDETDAQLLERTMIFQYFKVRSTNSVTLETAPIWDRPSTCIAHALDLLLTDFRGLRTKVRACPYIPHGPKLSEWDGKRIMNDHSLHFFVDARFEKGQPMIYCSPKHRQTAYMRKYRGAQAVKHK